MQNCTMVRYWKKNKIRSGIEFEPHYNYDLGPVT